MHAPFTLVALAITCPCFAQAVDGPAWSERLLPANVTNIIAAGSLVVVHTPASVEVFSAVLRAWTSIPVGSTARLHLGDNLCVVEDGGTLHACAAYAPGFTTLRPASGYVVSLAGNATVCVVHDGNTVHACSGFFGPWIAVSLTGTARFIAADSNVAAAADDRNVHAFSAFFNAWRTTSSRPGARHTAGKNCVVTLLSQPDEVKAWSAYRDGWSVRAWPTARASASAADSYALVVGAPDLLAFSALRGAFTTFAGGGQPIQVLVMAANVAVIWNGGALDHAYAPGQNRFVSGWTTASVPGQFHITRGNATTSFVSHADLNSVAFSSVRGTFVSAPNTSLYEWTVGDHVAFGVDQTASAHFAYSGIRGAWVPAPTTTVARAHATPESIVLETPTGLVGFSARSGAFSPSASAATTLVTRPDASIVAAADARGVDVFDPVVGHWSRVATTSSVTAATLAVAGVTAIAYDTARGYGYSLFSNTWDSIALQGTPLTHGAGQEAGYVGTTTHVYAFSAHGSLSDQSRHPDLPRAGALGASLRLLQTGPPGAAVAMLLSSRAAEIAVPPVGTLRVDLSLSVALPIGTIPSAGTLPFELPLPENLGIIGATLAIQDVVLASQGRWYLTNGRVVVPW